jgi:hypothetical protein
MQLEKQEKEISVHEAEVMKLKFEHIETKSLVQPVPMSRSIYEEDEIDIKAMLRSVGHDHTERATFLMRFITGRELIITNMKVQQDTAKKLLAVENDKLRQITPNDLYRVSRKISVFQGSRSTSNQDSQNDSQKRGFIKNEHFISPKTR